MATTSEKLPAFSSPPSPGAHQILLAAAPEICPEEVPEGQIIYIDDDVDPAPLQLLESQVDSLIMPPTPDMTPMAQRLPRHQAEISFPECQREENTPQQL